MFSRSLAAQVNMTQTLSSANSKSRVIHVHSDKVIDESGKINQALLQKMLDEAMLALTWKKSVAEAWQHYFTPYDIIGMKLNLNGFMYLQGTDFLTNYPVLTKVILNRLSKAGIPEQNAIIWDRSDQELTDLGYEIQKNKGALRIMGTVEQRRARGNGYSTETFSIGDKTTHVSNIITKHCTALINIPILKTHRNAGVTGSLKNHYGSIDNPYEFHSPSCVNPGIPEINSIPVIRNKQRLVICNGLIGLFDGGPRWQKEAMWAEGSLILGVDPVAVDTIMFDIIDKKRNEKNMESIAPRVKHLQLSEKLGLGTCDRDMIDLEKVEI